jgi:hypothetical protein
MIFWTGLAVFGVGVLLLILSHVLPGPGMRRIWNENAANLRRKLQSGYYKEMGERHEEFMKEVIDDQLQSECGPILIRRPSRILMAIGAVLAVYGYFF